jgi:hypothetical protein
VEGSNDKRSSSVAFKTKDEQTLRKYLLGDMSLKEQEELELWLMSSEEAYDLLVAAEDDLIDEALNNQLNGHELDRFNKHFLAAPERQRKLRFGRSFQRLVGAKVKSDPLPASIDASPYRARPSGPALPLKKGRIGFLDLFVYRPQIAYALSALIIALAVGGLWSAYRTVQLGQQLSSTAEQLAATERDRDGLKRQLGESQASAEKLQAQFDKLGRIVAASNPLSTSVTFVAVNLLPGISRSSADIPKITITPNSQSVQLSLILLDDNYDTYRATLLDSGGKELLTKEKLSATAAGNGKAVVVIVPSGLLPNGDYTVSLAGISDSRPPENISNFYFRAVRQ